MVSAARATARTREQLSALATHLGEQRELLLQSWRTATENVAELTIAISLTRLQFNDHIPGVLEDKPSTTTTTTTIKRVEKP